MKKDNWMVGLCGLWLWWATASVGLADPVRVSGTGTLLTAIQQTLQAKYQGKPEVHLQFHFPPVGSSGAIKALMQQQLELALTGRPLKKEEQEAGLVEIPLGRSPFVFVVHQNAKVTQTTLAEMTEIYAGRQRAWPDGGRIRVVLRPAADADTGILNAISPAMKEALTRAHANRQPGSGLAETDIDLADMVEKVPGAVGSVALTLILSEKRPLKPLILDGVEPTVSSMEENRYPLTKPAFLVIRQDAAPIVQEIADYLRSGEGQKKLHALALSNPYR